MRTATLVVVLLGVVLVQCPNLQITASPSSNNLNGLVMLSAKDGWAVGDGGIILHYQGSSWSQIPSGTTASLYGLSFGPPSTPSPNAGFTVGGSTGSAAALFWNGVAWSVATSGLLSSAGRLASVFLVSSSDAWTVDADAGGIWHWSGTPGLGGGWSRVSSAIAGLESIFMTSATDGWAVGVGGIIYHYSSGGWTLFSTVGNTLNSVFMLTPAEGWAVGNGGVIYHYSAGSWNGPVSPASTNNDLRSVFMTSQTEGWAVGASGTILHFLNGVWTAKAQNLSPTNQNLNAVCFSGSTGWAVGDSGTLVQVGGPLPQGIPATSLQSVFLLSERDGWIVGCSTGGCNSGAGEPVVAHWDGTSSTRATVAGPAADLYSVFMTNPSDGWAVGGVGSTPLILHYTRGSWNQVPAPSTRYVLHSIFMTDSDHGWAVGDGGTILRNSGGSWGAISSPTTNALRSVFMQGDSDGWAVGDGGTIIRYQGSSGQWFKVPGPTSVHLNSVCLLDSSHGWAVGAGGTILHYDGNVWTSVAGSVSKDLKSVFQGTPREAWAVGDSATILHWTGISWYPETPSPPLPGTPDLQSVFILPSGFGLVVGAPPSPSSQATIYPIPEFTATQMLLIIAFITILVILSRQQRKRKSPIER